MEKQVDINNTDIDLGKFLVIFKIVKSKGLTPSALGLNWGDLWLFLYQKLLGHSLPLFAPRLFSLKISLLTRRSCIPRPLHQLWEICPGWAFPMAGATLSLTLWIGCLGKPHPCSQCLGHLLHVRRWVIFPQSPPAHRLELLLNSMSRWGHSCWDDSCVVEMEVPGTLLPSYIGSRSQPPFQVNVPHFCCFILCAPCFLPPHHHKFPPQGALIRINQVAGQCWCTHLILALERQRQAGICEFWFLEASLVYRASSRTSKGTQRKTKPNQKPNQPNKRRFNQINKYGGIRDQGRFWFLFLRLVNHEAQAWDSSGSEEGTSM